jgi:hypothetical protein
VPAAFEAAAAKSRSVAGLSYVVGDVTRLPSAQLGTFDFFLDIGFFQGLDAEQRLSQGGGVCALGLGGRRGVAGDRVGFPLRTSTGRAVSWPEGLPRPAQ